jgi:hypothetical protein
MAQGGYEILKQRMAQSKANREQRDSEKFPRFTNPKNLVLSDKLPSVAQMRFVGEDIDSVFAWAWSHEMPISGTRKDGSTYSFKVWKTCADPSQENHDDCPACKAGIPVKQRFWANIIWRDAPLFELNQYGDPSKPYTIVGNEDRIVVWNTGVSLFGILDELQTEFGSVVNRDVRIKIEFSGEYTRYSLAPRQPDSAPLSDADKKLIEGAYDLKAISRPSSYNDLADMLGAPPKREDAEEDSARSFTGKNAYEAPGTQIKSKLAGRYEK